MHISFLSKLIYYILATDFINIYKKNTIIIYNTKKSNKVEVKAI